MVYVVVLDVITMGFRFGAEMSLGLKIEVVCEAANYTKIGDLLKYIGLPSVPRNLGPKPTLYSGQWAKNPQQTNFSGRKKTRGL